jgi:hypothetical protein
MLVDLGNPAVPGVPAVSSHGSVWLGPVADQLSALESFLSTGPAAPQPALL